MDVILRDLKSCYFKREEKEEEALFCPKSNFGLNGILSQSGNNTTKYNYHEGFGLFGK